MKRRAGSGKAAQLAEGGRRRRASSEVDVQRAWTSTGSRVERIDRVLVDDLAPEVLVTGLEAHHLRDVLRVRQGDAVEAFDGRGSQARGVVATVGQEGVGLTLGTPRLSSSEAPVRLTLAVALLKGDKLTDVVRPATEIGVTAFRLFVSTNCEARELSPVRLQRLRRVAQEAARQSGRAVVPVVEPPVPFGALRLEGLVVVGDPASTTSLARLAGSQRWRTAPDVTVVTGPEGGLTEAEIQTLVS
ncbi:MAG TPA: RsmE family RNA methyltransferase, partial [Trueperaceae bacterium]|nr:RsmE family RNA methyltransferase [Trueperaceae bacterium]